MIIGSVECLKYLKQIYHYNKHYRIPDRNFAGFKNYYLINKINLINLIIKLLSCIVRGKGL